MIIIHTRHFPFGSYTTINLFGILFTKNKKLSKRTINHERIHTKQMKEMLFIFFYLWYGLEYIIIRLFHAKQNDAYHDVSLEEEAHNNDDNQDYIYLREHYTWLKYIRIRSTE
jgi:hypothetical protein